MIIIVVQLFGLHELFLFPPLLVAETALLCIPDIVALGDGEANRIGRARLAKRAEPFIVQVGIRRHGVRRGCDASGKEERAKRQVTYRPRGLGTLRGKRG